MSSRPGHCHLEDRWVGRQVPGIPQSQTPYLYPFHFLYHETYNEADAKPSPVVTRPRCCLLGTETFHLEAPG